MTKLMTTRYIPTGAEVIEKEEIKMTVYLYTNSNNKPCAVAYSGKSSKADFHYNFQDEARRTDFLNEQFERKLSFKKRADEYKAERKKENEALVNDVKVGDIFYASWGYEQTNIDFYQVVAKNKSMLTIREIYSTLAEVTGHDQGNLKPLKNEFKGEEIKKRLSQGRLNIDCVRRATKLQTETVWASWYY